MPGIFKGNSGAQQPGGFKNFAIEAAPLFASLAAGYSSGRGPYAYMDQGLAAIQQRQKDRRDQEAAAAATAAFKGLMPGGMGGVTRSTMGGGVSAPAPVDPNSPDAVANAAMAALGKPPGGSTDWLKYSNSGATRNDPLDPKLVNAMSFLSDMGITMDVISGGQEAAGEGGARTGSTRHDHGGAADVDFYMGGRKLDWNNPNDMPILTQIVQRAKTNGVTGIGAGDDYMGAGRFHVGFGNPGVWGAGGKGANAPDWLTAAYNGAPGGDVTMSAQDAPSGYGMGGGPVDPMADPYVQQLMTVMAMPGLTPEQQSVVQLQLQSRIDMLSRPQPGAEEEAARARRARDAELLGYARGTPEWNQYVVTGEQPAAPDPMAAIRLKQAELDYQQDLTGGGADTATYGTTLQFFTGKDGKLRAGVLGNDGTMKEISPPDGGDWAQGVDKVDAGTKWIFYDKRTGQMVGEEPKDLRGAEAEKAIGKAEGEATGAAITGLSAAEIKATEGIALIDSIINDEALPGITGMIQGRLPPLTQAGTDLNVKIEQVQGKAFLEAFESLKGGGAISEREGEAATRAIARLHRSQSPEAYKAALKELKGILQIGLDNMKKNAGAPSEDGLTEDDLKYLE